MRRTRGWIWAATVAVVVLVVGGSAAMFVMRSPPETSAVEVEVAEVRRSEAPAFHEIDGIVVPATPLPVASPQEGVIETIAAADGATVQQGELLLELQATAPKTAVMAAEAEVEQLQASLAERTDGDDTPTPAVRDPAAIEVDLERARTRLRAAEASLEAHRIRAPAPGTVSLERISPGEPVNAGQLLAHVTVTERRLVTFTLPREVAAQRSGDTVDVLGANGQPTAAELTSEPAPGAAAEVALNALLPAGAPLGPGDRVAVRLPVRPQGPQVVAPETALVADEQGLALVLAVDDVARVVPVRIGKRHAGMIEVFGAVQPGDRVIVSNLDRIKDGTRIQAHGQRKALATTAASA